MVRKLNRRRGELVIPKAGRVRFRLSRALPDGKLVMAGSRSTVRAAGTCRSPASATWWRKSGPVRSSGSIVGVSNTLATSDGRMLRAPVIRVRERRRLQRLQQRLARQRHGSQRRGRTKRQIARVHQTVRDRRRNWIEIQTTRLVRDHDLIAVENLNVKGIVRRPDPKPDPEAPGAFLPNGAAAKSGLNRSIHAQGWSILLGRLRDKAQASAAHHAGDTVALDLARGRQARHVRGEEEPASVGTRFSFVLDQPARVSLAFVQELAGRKLKARCVAPTRANRRKHACQRQVPVATLTFTAHRGSNQFAFQGRVSRSKRLRPGITRC
jgi:putative transposase